MYQDSIATWRGHRLLHPTGSPSDQRQWSDYSSPTCSSPSDQPQWSDYSWPTWAAPGIRLYSSSTWAAPVISPS